MRADKLVRGGPSPAGSPPPSKFGGIVIEQKVRPQRFPAMASPGRPLATPAGARCLRTAVLF